MRFKLSMSCLNSVHFHDAGCGSVISFRGINLCEMAPPFYCIISMHNRPEYFPFYEIVTNIVLHTNLRAAAMVENSHPDSCIK